MIFRLLEGFLLLQADFSLAINPTMAE